MRLPSGYGSVYKLSGKRRKPYIARKTVGWDDNGNQIRETIGYFSTKADALQALADFNDSPYDLTAAKITFAEAYQKWYERNFDENSNASSKRNYDSAYKYCEPLYDLRMDEIRQTQLQKIIDGCGKKTQARRIKVLFNRVYEYCLEKEIAKKNAAKYLRLPEDKDERTSRKAFTVEEIEKLWKCVPDSQYIQIVLMLIYSGVRISELLDLKKEDVNLDEQYFYVRASKTNAGIRVVPIADKALPFWKEFISRSTCNYAVCAVDGQRLTYENFKKRYWHPLMGQLNLKHTPHETRHTFISRMVAKNVNQTIIKKVVGHKSIMSLTERVYTHIEIKELLEAVNKI